ncbi:hypothetical protein quinque_013879 [Culex quinquefasciatus]
MCKLFCDCCTKLPPGSSGIIIVRSFWPAESTWFLDEDLLFGTDFRKTSVFKGLALFHLEINPILPTFGRSSGMPLEGAVLPPTLPERSPQRAGKAGNDHVRSAIDQLLFQRLDKIESNVHPAARERKVSSSKTL